MTLVRESIVVCAVGDVMLNDRDGGSVLGLARPILREADITFGDCESAYSERWTRNGASGSGEGPKGGILAHPRNVAALRDAGFNVMTFANNHHMDCGDVAFFETLEHLHNHGIATCGAGRNIADAREPAIIERKGTRVAFLGYSSILFPGYAAGPSTPGCAPLNIHTYYRESEHEQPGSPAKIYTVPDADDLKAMQVDVTKAKERADVVVVSPHWGIHFKPAAIAAYETTVARAAIDAGADIVFGHHAHIMKGIQVYRRKAIVHCLGNFAFALEDMGKAEYWDDANIPPRDKEWRDTYGEYMMGYRADAPSYPFHPEARRVGLCRFTVANGEITRVAIVPCYVNTRGQPEPLLQAHQEFNEVADYLRDITIRAGFDTTFEQVGNELVVVA
jgi:Bacterial capsule synthesis protein PGA_cap